MPRLSAAQSGARHDRLGGGEAANAERWLLHATTVGQNVASDTFVARAWAELAAIYATQGRAKEAVAAANASLRGDPSGSSERLAWVGLATGEGMLRGARAGLDRLRQRLPQSAEHVPGTEADLLVTRGTLGFYAGRTTSAVLDMRALLRLARSLFRSLAVIFNSRRCWSTPANGTRPSYMPAWERPWWPTTGWSGWSHNPTP